MLGLEHHTLAVARKALDGGLTFAALRFHERDHDVVRRRTVLPSHEHEVAVADVRGDHALAAHAQREQVFAASRQRGGRDVQLALAVLTGEQRLTRRDAAEDWPGVPPTRRRVRRRHRARRASRAFPALQRPLALECAQMIERRAWRDLEPLADFAHGGWHAVPGDERADESQDLALLFRELAHHPSLGCYHTQRVLR